MGAVPASSDERRAVAGRYRLRSVLGSGAMGTVWGAFDEFLHRQVAVKEVKMPPGVPANQAGELRERTLREARAIAGLSHPNVIILHDVVLEHGDPYVVMELLPSRSLAGLLRDGRRLSVGQAAAVADAVAAALGAAHTAGITHRDVKPGNVLVAQDGRIKLTDFGIARNVSEVTMTHTGTMLGSPAFIAPEVASGGAVTYTADLWGLGATLFAATEGRPPYDVNGDPLETVSSVVHDAVPNPSPGPLAAVIRGLMAKEPSARMSLPEVRRRLYPFLAQPRHTLFGPELFRDDGRAHGPDAGVTRVIPAMPAAPKQPEPEADGQDGGALAADPGPLPFLDGGESPGGTNGEESRAQGRSTARTIALVLVVMLLFMAALAGGFALTRVLAGQPLSAPESTDYVRRVRTPSQEEQRLVTREGDATNLQGAKGGLFSVDVPESWTRFVTQQPEGALPTSTRVQFVSADGAQVLGVERFSGYGDSATVDDYLDTIASTWAPGDFTLVRSEDLPDRDGLLVTYRTAERGASGERAINRTTVAEVFLSGSSLWVVSVTVPVEQERLGRNELFDRFVPTFTMTD
ncbi:serine/threonine-protein kinase [Prauserella cavernicola]|uniref:non-specific serine/threonine protein kinase n=1 Tax=Prauserella cavernicola TaxID=2800127 RepID=A0A934QV45_9PSEU|nr:serine/threonine-protein kinase [Prauserella cavernicola]MBK1788812.1 serine/threonine protein kinase [Prauserella cavernicola]